ncbi:hypothetical protein EJV47_01685 [Hymenobacter gummosus]|uniref:STAS/SEC14 domain-containing protein n=1 Tax=Hymenobacter gummosus TaxID=1776032 RepID=A0A431U8T4_9BACT|nr:hypothetical protein [Hymenobacter gummosus]RTQ53477.1 hypothetical protein EJV47_01685 [Hymenobacter gummosus]
MSAAVTDFVDLAFRDDLDLLFGRWLRTADDQEVRQGYEAALALALPRRAHYWLLDLRRRGPISPAARRWLLESFLPRLVNGMPEPLHLAYLLSPNHLAEVSAEELSIPSLFHATCHIGLFTDEHSALQWLDHHREAHGVPH